MDASHVVFSRDIYQTIGATLLVTTGVSYLYKSFFASTNNKSSHYSKLAKTPLTTQYTHTLNIDAAEPKVSTYVACQFHYRGYHVGIFVFLSSYFMHCFFLLSEISQNFLKFLEIPHEIPSVG